MLIEKGVPLQMEIVVLEKEVCPKVVDTMNLITHHDFNLKRDPLSFIN